MTSRDEQDRFRGCLLGLAVGDAIGTTVEFRQRGSFEELTDMVGGGPFDLEPGQWTDDTSMALCLATSLLHCDGFNARDQMNRYCNWWQHGYLGSNGRCFDIGGTVRSALASFLESGDPMSGSSDPMSAGNGSIMRLAPVPMYYHPDTRRAVSYSAESSRTTHGCEECVDACAYLATVLGRALQGNAKDELLADVDADALATESIRQLASGEYLAKSEDEIRGSGYVVESLEAALWCFRHSSSFEDAVLRAVNLGDDADTTGAICGQIAGAFHGESSIPPPWLERLAFADEIRGLADRLWEA